MDLQDEGDKLFLIGLLIFIKLDDSPLQDVEEGVDALVVAFLLCPGSKP